MTAAVSPGGPARSGSARPAPARAKRQCWLSGEAGQATLEFVAMLPVLAAVATTLALLLAGYAAREAADQAAVAAAVAELQGRDAKAAARAASPRWTRVRVAQVQGSVRVKITPRVPPVLARAIAAERTVVIGAGIR